MGQPDDQDEEKKENILLDAVVTEMISTTAFRAVLSNGHSLVAYIPRRGVHRQETVIRVGDAVRVSMSPYDMSRGAVVHQQDVKQ